MRANFARSVEGVVIETFSHETLLPGVIFPPELAAQFSACPADVVAGWRFEDGTYSPPEPPPEAKPIQTVVIDVPTFLMRFHPQERVGIRNSQDTLIMDFLRLVDDPRVQNVNLAHPSVQGAVMYMALNAAPPLIAPERVAEILAPEPLA